MRGNYANKVDANQQEIVEAFEKCGATVQPLGRVGDGVPDLLIGLRNLNFLVEIKSGLREPLTSSQKRWHQEWRGQVCTIFSVEDAVAMVNSIRR